MVLKNLKNGCCGLFVVGAILGAAQAQAASDTYLIDSTHTYPAFEADHMGGLSLWRGKFEKTKGTVTLDREAKTGTVNLEIDANSIDFGYGKMNEHAKGPDMFDVEKYSTIQYVGKRMRFENGQPVEVFGELTLKGVTKPVNLQIKQFKCMQHPFAKKEVCGADAVAEFKRTDFGLDYGVNMGFKPEVKILISVEAIKQN